jgi:hypothetical protein
MQFNSTLIHHLKIYVHLGRSQAGRNLVVNRPLVRALEARVKHSLAFIR